MPRDEPPGVLIGLPPWPRIPARCSKGSDSLCSLLRDPAGRAVADRCVSWQAEKSLQSAGSGFSFFGGREDKYQNAAELFIQAANAFKMQKQSASPFHR